ncbi:MAG: peptide chain release factor 1, partial [Candidatus Aenigmatarchaeota archaeon]
IISSLKTVKMKGSFAKKDRYCLVITDYSSKKSFYRKIGFSSKKKTSKLEDIIKRSSKTTWNDQLPISGRHMLKLIRQLGMTTDHFPELRMYFAGRRRISYDVFRRIILPRVNGHSNETKVGVDVTSFLNKISKSDIIAARTVSIEEVQKPGDFYDMEVPLYRNFIANSFLLHNSQARYARIREGLLNDFMKKVGDTASAQFKGLKELVGIIIGGPGPIKEEFYNGEFLTYDIKKKVLGVIDTSYSGIPGLNETVERSDELLKEASVTRERKLLERFFGEFAKDSGLAIYGLHEVIEALKAGNVDILLISEEFDWVRASFECPKCDFKKEEVLRSEDTKGHTCDKCNSDLNVTGENDITEEIVKMAEETGATVEYISTDTAKGEQLKEIGGIAGILRFKAA